MIEKEIINKLKACDKIKDFLIVGSLVLIYSIISFINLGDATNPQTFCEFAESDEIVFELEKDTEISKIRYFLGDIEGELKVYESTDGNEYQLLGIIKGYALSWNDLIINNKCKYIKIQGEKDNKANLGEIQLYDKFGYKIKAVGNNAEANKTVDEASTVPETISYKNSAYFDEVYFATSVYEFTNGYLATEWTHPHLGKIIQAIPAWFLGTTPFSYRLMGNIAGILMIIVMYFFGKELFRKRRYAFLVSFLMAFDNFHFVQTRLGTVDSFLVLFCMISTLFMLKYIKLDLKVSLKRKLMYLFGSGLFFGFAISVKWLGFYTGLGLAILFLSKIIFEIINNKKITKENIITILACIVFFIIIPLIIYVTCYFIYQTVYGEIKNIGSLVEHTKDIYNFHSTLTETHPFESRWYTWPIMLKPIWYYNISSNNISSTIASIGNPAIWWFGIVAMVFLILKSIIKKEKKDVFIILMYLSVWLPFAIVNRPMFIYHYFMSLPFVILAIGKLMEYICEKTKKKGIILAYSSVVLIMFIAFYPIVSGLPVTTKYNENMHWLSTWVF